MHGAATRFVEWTAFEWNQKGRIFIGTNKNSQEKLLSEGR
jgi:hypothetical protein